MPGVTTVCPECGATGRFGTCPELFGVLLALDHQRRQPWGAFHAVNVACYVLRHRARTTDVVLAGEYQVVETFVRDGLGGVRELAADRVRTNRRGAQPRPLRAGPIPPLRTGVTIEDVSVDGTFPAEGYEQRMEKWARSLTQDLRRG